MASIVLQAAGSALGGVIGGGFGSFLGGRIGRFAGGFLDDAIFGPRKLADREGPRLADLSVQTSTYGKMIPITYGSVRIAGNIIWSQPIKETVVTSTSAAGGGKGGGGKVEQTTKTYQYSVTLAIALCAGPVDTILRAWADAKQLNLAQGTYRFYKGDEAQAPDSFIEGVEGVGKTPAYRGLAYVVIEDFPLADYGNRIPNFTFEVKKKVVHKESTGLSTEEMVEAVIMIPGSGEFVYDTQVDYKLYGEMAGSEFAQNGASVRLNQHAASDQANAMVALDHLEETLPNVQWVGVVVNWFGDDLDAANCIILPGVEYQTGAVTSPETWTVGSFTRASARQITLVGGSPRYGGTPDDQSLLRYLDELKERGYNIMFYPMFLMDVADKPWRGRVTGTAGAVSNFFTKTNGYNAFVTHYANLVAGKVDAFVIGSELIGLTKVTDTPGNYPAVDELVSLAATVKGILGGGVKVTYAADWSEYHHTDGGWYNLDPLWASSDIDFVGIDAYLPLTDEPQPGISLQDVIDGWTSGEGYSFYYTDSARTTQAPLAAPYAWKNISWWWNNTHTNPDASTTSWTPGMKKIWLTEYGFPSVDGSTNQPNVFYDPLSVEGKFPRFSRGRVDNRAQRMGITATELQWWGSSMVERKFLWTWDARPFPYFPDRLDVWADGGNWAYGHWVQGKLGMSSLAAIVQDICLRAGLEAGQIDVSRLEGLVEGFALTHLDTARAAIEALMKGYFFDAVETGDAVDAGQLLFRHRGEDSALTVASDVMVPSQENKGEAFLMTRVQEAELPQRVEVSCINRTRGYQATTQRSERQTVTTQEVLAFSLPIVMADGEAQAVADKHLAAAWTQRSKAAFSLPMQHAAVEPTDVISVTHHDTTHRLRVTSVHFGKPGVLKVEAVADDIAVYDTAVTGTSSLPVVTEAVMAPVTKLELLDLPALPGDAADAASLRLAGCGRADGWKGAVVYRAESGTSDYARFSSLPQAAAIGAALDVLPSGATGIFDDVSSVTVVMLSGGLESMSELRVLNGGNIALLGEEIIQFRNALLAAPGKYVISGLLRGRQGTEWAMGAHAAGERFVLLDGRIAREDVPYALIGLSRDYKPVSVGATLGATSAQGFAYQARCLKPLSPVHVTGARDGSGNLTITWVRRTRVGGEWRDFVDVPLSEEREAYEVEILDGTTVVRTITGLDVPAAEYLASQQTADFGSAQSAVAVKVYQLSMLAGRGIGTEKTV
ncbi:MAG: glycoside hydrolase TIM-barrel-like domain-containing protein [Alphaproteobacteria bacterium]|nr:glycoside hydrolase TIM-barrel-like domain-containing protein [Alphaproteobacteria bacterium]